MRQKREKGDDRVMWKVQNEEAPGCWGTAAVVDTGGDVLDIIGGDVGDVYRVQRIYVTAAEWNAMPESVRF